MIEEQEGWEKHIRKAEEVAKFFLLPIFLSLLLLWKKHQLSRQVEKRAKTEELLDAIMGEMATG